METGTFVVDPEAVVCGADVVLLSLPGCLEVEDGIGVVFLAHAGTCAAWLHV